MPLCLSCVVIKLRFLFLRVKKIDGIFFYFLGQGCPFFDVTREIGIKKDV